MTPTKAILHLTPGANFPMPTPLSGNLTSEKIDTGTKSYSTLVSERPVFELVKKRQPLADSTLFAYSTISADNDEDFGEDLESFWSALEYVDQAFEMIQDEGRQASSICPLLDKMSKDDLLELLFPKEFNQLQRYLEHNEDQ